MKTFTKEMLLSKVNAFSKPIKNAIITYFTWVENECLRLSEFDLTLNIDKLFAKADPLFYGAFLPLPHPKVVISDEDRKFQGVANFDLGFCISGKVYLLTFSDGQFIRKTERKFRRKLLENNDRLIFVNLPKPPPESDLNTRVHEHIA